jgi:hypothetical protein
MHFCPHLNCDYWGWVGLNNLRANGHPSGGPWRQFYCLGCSGFFPEHHRTIFHGKQVEGERIVRVLRRRATHNRLFVSMGELRATLRNNICYFQTMRQKVLSLIESPRKAKKEAKLAVA